MDSFRWARQVATFTLGACCAVSAFAQSTPAASAQPFGKYLFQTSLYTTHFSPSPDHVNHQNLINFEYWREDRWLAGLAFFRNSFGQPSQYVYVGKQWRPFQFSENVYLKLTGGLLHGYKDQYRDKIPFNQLGVAPAILPSIGISNRRFNAELVLFGTAGLMVTAGVFFD
jgi:hypothetical protein